MRLVLASESPARLALLRFAGLHPEVIVSGFDESSIVETDPTELASRLAEAKADVVVPSLTGEYVLIACDSVLEFEGHAFGKPGTAEAATALWRRIRNHQGLLHTGHHVVISRAGEVLHATRVCTTTVQFADLDEDEISAYVATGEPQRVAGGFTTNGFGGAFVTSIVGDPGNVVGLSLPLMRQMVIDGGVPWPSLWA